MQENPFNCATAEYAARLLAHLATLGLHPTPSRDWPQAHWGGPNSGQFQQEGPGDGKVPYLDFLEADGVTIDHECVGGIGMEYYMMGQALTDYNCGLWYKGDA
jgi:hypothetical protein